MNPGENYHPKENERQLKITDEYVAFKFSLR